MQNIDNRRFVSALAAFAIFTGVGVAGTANAAAIQPTFDTFGLLSTEFGGDGIPSDNVAVTNIQDGGNSLTLGLAATPRFSEPAPGNDGAGTYSAAPGGYPGSANLARWNFSFYAGIEGATVADYAFNLLYDFDPAVNTDSADHGALDPSVFSSPGASVIEESQNLGFNYLAVDALPLIDSPTQSAFDPQANGEYTFALQAFSLDGVLLGQSAIRVNVGEPVAAVPEPSSLAIFGVGVLLLAGLIGLRRRDDMSDTAA